LIAPLLLFCLVIAGCGQGDSAGTEETQTMSAEVDSSETQTTEAADSVEVVEEKEEKKEGFFARLFNKGKDDEEEEDDPVPVELASVERRDLPSYLGATATLEPERQAEILAKVGGEIRRILVEEGDRVEQGTVLAILDGATQAVALEEAEARLRALERQHERISALHTGELASEKDLLDAAARMDEAAAQRNAAKLQVDYTRILAPFSGQIGERYVDQGQTVSQGTRLFSIVDRQPLLARIYLPEKEAKKVQPGQEVVIQPDTDVHRQVPGEVLRIAPIVDPRTGTIKVTCAIAAPTDRLHPGSFVRVLVETEVHQMALCIPKRALVPEGAATYVYKTVADSVEKVPIRTGYSDDLVVEVLEGLNEGERVVTVGQGALRSGTKIREIGKETSLADSATGTE
jgi:RND family efflux transporter MFP subunit